MDRLTRFGVCLLLCVSLLVLPGVSTACSPLVSSYIDDASFNAKGGTGNLVLIFNKMTNNCQWTATSSASWVTIISDASGTGPGTVSFGVSENHGADFRQASIIVNDSSFSITQQPTQYTFALNQGWNFISLPLQSADTTIADISWNVRIIWSYDNQNKVWLRYKPGDPNNTFLTVEPYKGYWVYADNDTLFSLWGKTPSFLTGLFPGWNLIGMAGEDNIDVSRIPEVLSPGWIGLWNWDQGVWKLNWNGRQFPAFPAIATLTLGKAYWLKVTSGGSDTIGPNGGTIGNTAFSLTVPQGALPEDTPMQLVPVANSNPTEAASLNAYRIIGLPADFTVPLTVKMQLNTSCAEGMYMRIGVNVYDWKAGGYTTQYSSVPAACNNGYLIAEIPAPAIGMTPLSRSPLMSREVMEGTIEARRAIGASRIESCSGNRFRVIWPDSAAAFPRTLDLCAELNRAYATLVDTLGLSVARRTVWPMTVNVASLQGIWGEFADSRISVNWDELNFNTQMFTSNLATALKETVIHELFHFIQGLYASAPLGRIDPNTWIDEAASVWVQQYAVTDTGYVPADFIQNMQESLTFPPPTIGWPTQAQHNMQQNHGYGLAVLFEYIRKYHDPTGKFIVRVFDYIHNGQTPARAIIKTIMDLDSTAPSFWWSEYLYYLVTGGIYPFSTKTNTSTFLPMYLGSSASGTKTVPISLTTPYTDTVAYPDLSARLYRIPLNTISWPSDYKLHLSLDDTTGLGRFRVFKANISNTGQKSFISIDPYETVSHWAEYRDLIIDSSSNLTPGNQEFFVVVFNMSYQTPDSTTPTNTITLRVAIEGQPRCGLDVATLGTIAGALINGVLEEGHGYGPWFNIPGTMNNGTYLYTSKTDYTDTSTPPVLLGTTIYSLTFTLNQSKDKALSFEAQDQRYAPAYGYWGCEPECFYSMKMAIKGGGDGQTGIPRRTDMESPAYPRIYYINGPSTCNYITSQTWKVRDSSYQNMDTMTSFTCDDQSYLQIKCAAPYND